MKKLLSVFFTICILAAFPALPHAKERGENFAPINCKTKSSGITTFYSLEDDKEGNENVVKKFLVSGTKMSYAGEETDPEPLVKNGYDTSGVIYAKVQYEMQRGYIDVKDLVADGEFSLNDAQIVTFPTKLRVIDRGGIIMYKGPNLISGEVQTIPYGSDITITYTDLEGAPTYGYTTYEGKSGWVYIYEYPEKYTVAFRMDETSFVAGRLTVTGDGAYLVDINETDSDGSYKHLSDIIPEGTDFKYDVYVNLGDGKFAGLTEYKGTQGWLIFSLRTQNTGKAAVMPFVYDALYVGKDSPVYAERGKLASKTEQIIPGDTLVNLNAYYADNDEKGRSFFWLLVEYKGKNVWIVSDGTDGTSSCVGQYSKGYVVADSINVYGTADVSSEPIGKVYYGEDIYLFMRVYQNGIFWYYVSNENVDGLIINSEAFSILKGSQLHRIRIDEEGGLKGIYEDLGNSGLETTKPAKDKDKEKTTEPADDNERNPVIIFVCIAAGVVVAVITAIVTVTELKKKRKEK